jgi:hypothetical protein
MAPHMVIFLAMSSKLRLLAKLLGPTALLAACSSTPQAAEPELGEPAPAQPAAEAAPATDLPPGTLARAQVDQVLLRRPGWLLSKVEVEEVLRQNKFVGWRVVRLPSEWDGSGLQPGDVVTDVNGLSLEKPDDLWNAWLAMADANELKIAFERDSKTQTATLKIDGDPSKETKDALLQGEPAAQAPQAPSEPGRKQTVVIQGDKNPIESSSW